MTLLHPSVFCFNSLMDRDQLTKQARELEDRYRCVMVRVAEVAKAMEPILRDTNHHHSADRLAAALGELEAAEAAINVFFRENRMQIKYELTRFGG